MHNSKLETKPNITHLNEIHDWLKEEYLIEQNGFYSNWRKIKEAFEDGELLIYEVNKVAVGFIVFTEIDSTFIIDIAEIKPSQRNQGLGSELINQAISHFKSIGAKSLKVYCSSSSSKTFWRKLGFSNSNDPLIELGVPLVLTINTILNVKKTLSNVTFPSKDVKFR